MKSWVTVSIPDTFSVEPTKSVFNYITVSLPTTVPLGTYMFNVISCRTDGLNPVSTSAACTAVTTNYGSGVQPLEIIVKS
jgi:hypothetical protein